MNCLYLKVSGWGGGVTRPGQLSDDWGAGAIRPGRLKDKRPSPSMRGVVACLDRGGRGGNKGGGSLVHDFSGL